MDSAGVRNTRRGFGAARKGSESSLATLFEWKSEVKRSDPSAPLSSKQITWYNIKMTNLRITNELNSGDRGDLMSVLRGERLWIPTSRDYPRHNDWLDSTEAAIGEGNKHAFFARIDSSAAGAIVYRADPRDDTVMDIRNISIIPSSRGRLLGSFMLRQVEVEARESGSSLLRVDTKLGNEAMIGFLINNGYTVKDITDLYGDETGEDVVLVKNIG